MTKIYSNTPVPSKAFRNRKTTIADELEIGQSIFFCQEKEKGALEPMQAVYKRIINLSQRARKSDPGKVKKIHRSDVRSSRNQPARCWHVARCLITSHQNKARYMRAFFITAPTGYSSSRA